MSAKCYVYRNLRTGGFSVRRGGIVEERFPPHLTAVMLDCTFKVNQAGRQRVLREKQKNVHAFIVSPGGWTYIQPYGQGFPEIRYNPYTQDHFTCAGEKIEHADVVMFTGGKCYLVKR